MRKHLTNPGPQRTQVRDRMRRQQDAFQVGPPSRGSMRACNARSPHQSSPSLAVTWCPSLQACRRTQRQEVPELCLIASLFSRSLQLLGFDALTMQRSACGHRTKTSIQNCCRTPGKQETTSIVAHLSAGSPSGCGFSQIVQLRDMSFPVCVSSSVGDPSAQCAQDSTVRPGPGTSVFAPQSVTRVPSLVGGRTFNPRCPCAGRTWRAVPRTLT